MEKNSESDPKPSKSTGVFEPGRRVGGYIIGDQIAKGGMGRLFRAWDTSLNRPVAMKILAGSQALDGEEVARFEREVKTLAKLSHPSIVQVLDAGEFDGRPYFVMELVDGIDLEEFVEENSATPKEVVGWGLQVCAGLSHLHREGLVHRDIKPANVVRHRDGHVTLVDFGLAYAVNQRGEELTQTGVSLGTPAYMAPEQAKGQRDQIDWRTDVYQLGAMIFALLAGRPPQRANSPQEMIRKVADAAGPDWRGVAIAKPLRAIIQKAMAKNPQQRYASVDAMRTDLERWQDGEWVLAQNNPLGRTWSFFLRRLALPAIILVLGAAMTYAVITVDGGEGEGLFAPRSLTYTDSPDGFQLYHVGGIASSESETIVERDATLKNPWIGVATGGRLTWHDFSAPEGETNKREKPADVMPIWLGRRDFRATFGLRLVDDKASEIQCFCGAPWHDPQSGLSIALDPKANRLRAARNQITFFDIAWPALRGAQRVSIEVTRRGRKVELKARVGTPNAPSLDVDFRDELSAIHRADENLDGGDMQIGVVTLGDKIAVESITYEKLLEQHSPAHIAFVRGAYRDALEDIDARFGPLSSSDGIESTELAELHFMRAECLRELGIRPETAMRDYQFAIQSGNDELRFEASMANLEFRLEREEAEVAVAKEPRAFLFPASIDTRIRAMTAAQPARASIYSQRLLRFAQKYVDQSAPHNEEVFAELFESALTSLYRDDTAREAIVLASLRDWRARMLLDPKIQKARVPSAAEVVRSLNLVEILKRHAPMRRWPSTRGLLLEVALLPLGMPPESRSSGELTSAMLERSMRLGAALLLDAPEWRGDALTQIDLLVPIARWRAFEALKNGERHFDASEAKALLQSALLTLRPEVDSALYYRALDERERLEQLEDLLGESAEKSAAAALPLSEFQDDYPWELLGFEGQESFEGLVAVLRFRHMEKKDTYIKALQKLLNEKSPESDSLWIIPFLQRELDALLQ